MRCLVGGGRGAVRRGRKVVVMGKRTSVSGTVLLERWLNLGQALRRDAVPDPIILIHQYFLDLLGLGVDPLCYDGDNLVLELARLVGCCGFLEGLG